MSAPTRTDAMLALVVDAVTSWVLRELDAAGVQAMLIKGQSIGSWLYEPGELRLSADVDVLIHPTSFARAESVLAGLGFHNRYDGAAPEWTSDHADSWSHPDWAANVDLHRAVWGSGADAAAAWDELTAGGERLEIAGTSVRVPRTAIRLMLLVLHAHHHGGAGGRPPAEVLLAIARVERTLWDEAVAAARRLGWMSAFAEGLALAGADQSFAEGLGLSGLPPAPARTRSSLIGAPPTTEGLLRLRDLRTPAARIAFLRREAFPSPSFMRSRSRESALARRGRVGLVEAYALRLVRTIRSFPSGWRAARRLASSPDER